MVEPEVTINNQWSDRYTVIEVSGLDRPGLLYQLTTAISKLNLNIASAHVATFGERARDVFYVTDLLGAQINAPTRQAAIKSALIHLLANDESRDAAARREHRDFCRTVRVTVGLSATPSCSSSHRLRSSPPPYLTSEPSAPIRR